MERRLFRSRSDRMIAGVCGGLSSYFGIDAILVRLVFVLLAFSHGLGLITYVVLAVVVPQGSPRDDRSSLPPAEPEELDRLQPFLPEDDLRDEPSWLDDSAGRTRRRYVAGVFLLVAGGVALLINVNLLGWLDLGRFWPLILVAIGVVMLLQPRKH